LWCQTSLSLTVHLLTTVLVVKQTGHILDKHHRSSGVNTAIVHFRCSGSVQAIYGTVCMIGVAEVLSDTKLILRLFRQEVVASRQQRKDYEEDKNIFQFHRKRD